MLIRVVLFALTLLVIRPARGATIMFLEVYERGQLIQFEPNGRFGHCAIRAGRYWLHAHPRVDVQLTDDLSSFGENPEVWVNPHLPDPTTEQVQYYLELRFNHDLKWTHDDDGTTYCSRLVGELIGLKPEPAYFMGPAFRHSRVVPSFGEVGLSPDDLRAAMQRLGFTRVPTRVGCAPLLAN